MTTKPKDTDKVGVFKYTVFKLNGVTYVPHYRDVKRYVGPGYPKNNTNVFTTADLFSAGAKPETAMLWKRSEYGILNPHTGKIE